jgi:hypothetical protein
MAQTTTRRRSTTKAPATRKRAAAAKAPTTPRLAAAPPATPIDRTAKLSNEVLESLEAGQRAAIDAVHKFLDTVEKTLPGHGESPSGRQEIVDSAMEMADRLVHTQYDFIRKVTDSAGKSLRRPDGGKTNGKE